MNSPGRFAVVDLETTGLYPGGNHRVIEIGVVLTDGKGAIDYEWSTLVNPHRDLGDATIHGITGAMVADAPLFSEVAGDLSVLLDGRVLVAHNARFDTSFLAAEWQRLGWSWSFDALCTMQLARRHGMPGKLSKCCEAIGVVNDQAHHALGDARVTAMLLAHLHPDQQVLPEPIHASKPRPEWAGYVRERPSGIVRTESGLIAALISELPEANDHGLDDSTGAVSEYRDVLDRALEDRVLTDDEAGDLAELARDWELSLAQVEQIHESYLTSLIALAAADGKITEAELADVTRVGDLLGVDRRTLDQLVADAPLVAGTTPSIGEPPAGTGARDDLNGKRVCFTGASTCSVDGEPLTREAQGLLAAAHGLVVCKSVTKKLDVLVVADPDSQSGKARKARDYGTRIIAERAFWERLGVLVD